MDEDQILEYSKQSKFSPDVLRRFYQRYGTRTTSLIDSIKRPGKYQAIRINTLKTSISDFKKDFLKLGQNFIQHPQIPEILLLEVKGPFQLKRYNKTVMAKKQAAESVLTGTNLYAPGVNRAAKIKPGDNVSIININNDHVANGIAMMTAREMLESKKGLAVDTNESIWEVLKLRDLNIFDEGKLYIQSLPAAITAKNLNPNKKDMILDLCAAPGGKSTYLAQLMENQGKIIAIDKSKPRIRQFEEHIKRLGIKNIEIYHHKEMTNLKKEYLGMIDKVVVDPPCSSIGVRPKLFDNTTEKEILDSAKFQKNFLHQAKEFLKPGGEVVYSTCTLEPEENELNIKYAVEKLDFELIKQDIFLGSVGKEVDNIDHTKLQRFYPDIHDMPGYFIAKLRKK